MAKTVLITGASRGIGRAIALLFGKNGYQLILNGGHDKKALEETKEKCNELGYPNIICFGDVGDEFFVKKMFEEGIESFSHIDVLINNAGIAYLGLLQDMTLENWHRILSTNLDSAFLCCREVIPHMLEKHSGSILNITSVWGEVGASYEAAYSASKGGMNALTKALAKELAPSTIAVNAISCGAINTSMNDCYSEEEHSALVDEIPSGRMGTPEEVADLAYSIVTSSPYLTGQIIRIDGAWQ